MSYIGRAWRGEAELWTIFWLGWFWFIVVLLLGILAGWVGMHVLPDRLSEYLPGLLGFAICGWWFIWWPVSLWRCSENTDHAIWMWLARIIVVFDVFCKVASVAVALYSYVATGHIPSSRDDIPSHLPSHFSTTP